MLFFSINVSAQGGAKWSLLGNETTVQEFLGTLNPQPLIFKTNNLEYMRLTPDGNLDIGVVNPAYKLDVAEDVRMQENVFIDSNLTVRKLIVLYDIEAGSVSAGSVVCNAIHANSLKLSSLSGNGNKLVMAGDSGSFLPFYFSGNGTDVLYGNGQ